MLKEPTTLTQQLKAFRQVDLETFMNIPFIQKIKDKKRWTFSDENKRPIDAKRYIQTGQFIGARNEEGYNPLVKLTELNEKQELLYVNRTFKMSGFHEKYFMLDVEPNASDEAKQRALQMPSEYTEVSTNGGIHVFIQVPDHLITEENEYLFTLTQFKDDSNKWEVFFNNHYVTFTKKALTPRQPDYSNNSDDYKKLKGLLDYMVNEDRERKEQRERSKAMSINLTNQDINKNLIQRFENTLDINWQKNTQQHKDQADFNNDTSKYEASVATAFAFTIKNHLKRVKQLNIITYDKLNDIDFIYIIAKYTKEVVPYRPKHDEYRDSLPWLMYNAKNAWTYAQSQDDENDENDE